MLKFHWTLEIADAFYCVYTKPNPTHSGDMETVILLQVMMHFVNQFGAPVEMPLFTLCGIVYVEMYFSLWTIEPLLYWLYYLSDFGVIRRCLEWS